MKMLRPNKHTHPDKTIINMSFLLLTYIKKKRLKKYDSLLEYAKKSVEGGHFLFLPALNLLFLLGLIEYHAKTDSIEYVGINETI
ncbi:hypothetical protein GA0061080_100536 [Gilliamella intestini]|uniref:Uncharacterized protein n=2 Tax=Gilliamella intestini TaxID=1798183 RepID=A0A1C3ZK61_9GAMM|nr:hypothetical protein GA0061080_100536 [Gilliamella intestini]